MVTPQEVITLWSLVVILVTAPFLALWDKFRDGIVGKILLGGMAAGSLIIIIQSVVEGTIYHTNFATTLLIFSVSGFMLRYIIVRLWMNARHKPQRRKADQL